MLNPNFVLLGVLLNVIGSISYLIQTVQGKVKPNRITWGLWALAPLIAFAAEIKQGVGIQSLMTFITGFNPFMVFIASFVNKKSVWKLGRLDIICAIITLLTIKIWTLAYYGFPLYILLICSLLFILIKFKVGTR